MTPSSCFDSVTENYDSTPTPGAVPLSKLKPRIIRPPPIPASTEPGNDSAITGNKKWGTEHRRRSFIVGKTTSKNDSTMMDQVEEEEKDGSNDPDEEVKKRNN